VDHPAERRTNTVTYNKPELQPVGRATDVIESLNIKRAVPSDGEKDPQHTASAYDLDE
jgi:hypothetical protein